MQVVQVLTRTDDDWVAVRLVEDAIAARVAACGHVRGAVRSVYWWEGRIERTNEWEVELITAPAREADARAHLAAGHNYSTPAILSAVLEADDAYGRWVYEQTTPA